MSEVTADQAAEAEEAAAKEAGTPPAAAEPTPPSTPESEPAENQTRDYLVLSNDGGDKWIPLGIYNASSARAAVKAYVKKTEAKSGSFVAVTERSWKPMTLELDTQTKIKLT